MTQRFQQISTFEEEPYSKILCFPKVKESEVKKRLKANKRANRIRNSTKNTTKRRTKNARSYERLRLG